MTVDWTTVTAEILRGIVDLVVGGVVGYTAYRWARRRDQIKRQRELDELYRARLREDLTRGLDNPTEAINALSRWIMKLPEPERSARTPDIPASSDKALAVVGDSAPPSEEKLLASRLNLLLDAVFFDIGLAKESKSDETQGNE